MNAEDVEKYLSSNTITERNLKNDALNAMANFRRCPILDSPVLGEPGRIRGAMKNREANIHVK